MKNYLLVYTQPGGPAQFMAIKAENDLQAVESATQLWCCIMTVNCYFRLNSLLDAETYKPLPLDVASLEEERKKFIKSKGWLRG